LLADETKLPVHLWDERLTTMEAHRILYELGRPRTEHRALVDQVAAVIILQGFLDARRLQPRS
jgi:putative Holliday junction resolvase